MGEDFVPRKMPREYREPATKQGSIHVIEYYTKLPHHILKHATIYLPYGYEDSDEHYPVLYLQHGRGGTYRTWLGTSDEPRPFKNIIDNMIEHGDIRPCIVVAPNMTYRYGSDSNIMEGMSDEFAHILIPLIDSKYRTIADRAGRTMAGFSMGGSLTWHMLKDHADMVRNFIPMSMALYYDSNGYNESLSKKAAASIAAGIASHGLTTRDISVFAASGERDHKKSALVEQVRDLVKEAGLTDYDLHVWPKRRHTFKHSYPYLYNALIKFLH